MFYDGCIKMGVISFRIFILILFVLVVFEDDKLLIYFWVLCIVMKGILNWVIKLLMVEEINFLSFEELKEMGEVWFCLSFWVIFIKYLFNMFFILEVFVLRVLFFFLSLVIFVDFCDLVRDFSVF